MSLSGCFLSFQACFLLWEVEAALQSSGLMPAVGWTFTRSTGTIPGCRQPKKVTALDIVESLGWDLVYQTSGI